MWAYHIHIEKYFILNYLILYNTCQINTSPNFLTFYKGRQAYVIVTSVSLTPRNNLRANRQIVMKIGMNIVTIVIYSFISTEAFKQFLTTRINIKYKIYRPNI